MAVLYLILGALFGFILSRSGAADYNYIQAMFLFESIQLYGIIGTAVVLTAGSSRDSLLYRTLSLPHMMALVVAISALGLKC